MGHFPLVYRLHTDVVEVYAPDFRPPILNAVDISQVNPTTVELQKVNISRNEVWQILGDNNDWSNHGTAYMQAKIRSLPSVFELRRKLEEYLREKN